MGLAALVLTALLVGGVWRAVNRQAAADALERADQAYRRADLLQALRWVNESLEIRPGDRAARALRERIFETRARIVAEEQPRHRPAEPATPEVTIVRGLLGAGRAGEARDRLNQLLSRGPDREASWLMSRALLQLDDAAGAMAALKDSGSYGHDDPTAPEPARHVGSSRCVECHKGIAESQRASRHAHTLPTEEALAGVAFPTGPIPDPGNAGVTHRMQRRGEVLEMVTTMHEQALRATVRYVLGSGNRGQSFIARSEHGQDLLLRMTYYDHGSVADLTPMIPLHLQLAHDHLGVALTPERLKGCLDCHATNVSLTAEPAVLVAEPGIGCEKCHGPGGNHVKAVAAKFPEPAIGQLRGAPAPRVVAVCARCHQPPGNEVLDDSDPTLVRQQALTMPRSRCYTESGEGVSCVTCHSPHRDVETMASHYERKCLACHTAGRIGAEAGIVAGVPASRPKTSSVCPVNSSANCVGCHMPKVENPAEHAWFTDHHIRIHRDSPSSQAQAPRHEPDPPVESPGR
ncbi:tetratricopeptide repeat protein [Aquisphaera giovannonii]|uniref:tetratricopeptide repeat protein n=1 Tax=Aquisphaera giovannonii TaxID=406548 RepID=UPI00143D24C7|nr:multiheme c-type cytochrome [Aquisphaera giovannonii]